MKKVHKKKLQQFYLMVINFKMSAIEKKTTSSPRRRVHHSMLFTEIAQSKKVIDDVFFPSNE